MPLKELPAELALQNLRSRSAIWPSRGKGNRKGLVPLAEIKPSFQFGDNDSIFCLGSCFAQHVGLVLEASGFKVVTNQANPYLQGDWGGANHLIRYNVFSMLNEFRWALDPSTPFDPAVFVEEQGGLLMDPTGHYHVHPHGRDALSKLREFTVSVTKRLAECRVVVVTLGLVEVWYDRKIGTYTNIQPGKQAMRTEPERFTLRVLDYKDVLEGLEAMHGLLARYGHSDVKMLVTTSPVPLHATFTGQDVFVANTYSKSVQRAAVGEFVSRHDNVDYFPSFEAITLGNPDLVWKEDQRHVSELPVQGIMEHVLRAYAPQKRTPIAGIQQLERLDQQLGQFGGQFTFANMAAAFNELTQRRLEVEKLRTENAVLKATGKTISVQ
jgi:hypothetical protein